MLPAIEAALATDSFGVVGHRYGVSGETIKNFLRRHGVDTAQYRKTKGTGPRRHSDPGRAVDVEGWPAAEIPEKTMKLYPAPDEPKVGPSRMKFKRIQVKNTWGHKQEIEVPEAIGTEKDPETGATVTKYPAGYAIGAGPQKNVRQGDY